MDEKKSAAPAPEAQERQETGEAAGASERELLIRECRPSAGGAGAAGRHQS